MTTDQIKALQDSLVKQGYMTQAEVNTGYGIYGPKTTAAMDKAVADAVSSHPGIAPLTKNNDASSIVKAYMTGDWSGISNVTGKPFTDAEQKAAVDKATSDLSLGFQADASKAQSDTETSLSQKRLDYQKYLSDQASKFQADKSTLDQNAANQGVLFSGMRKQKEQNLANAYNADQAYKLGTMTNDISNIASGYQYKYGNNAANNLSSYYALGSNAYNPGVATGGVGSGSLSSVYNPGTYNYQGTQNVANQAAIQQRAAGLLWNQGNKMTVGGNANKY